jgi:membrane protein DedA with SNARE-associated domain/rhodanese-related sulfurtransferase
MSSTVELLIRHGYSFLFAWIFTEQIGLPIPSAAVLVAAGALSGTGHMNIGMALLISIAAVGVCDVLWYQLGRRRGVSVLRWICRVSIEPDSCVHQTQVHFERRGPWALLLAKFVPGPNAVAPPLAGLSGMPWKQFALYDGLGSLLWAGGYIGAGYLFSDQLARAAVRFAIFGRGIFATFVAALLLYIGWKYVNRRRFLRKLRIARITPRELHQRIEGGESVLVIDLRHAMEFKSEPETIPGAVHLDPGELDEALETVPRDREIVLFCSCPNEASSAQMALRLRNRGISRIRPLAGGLNGWRACGFALQPLGPIEKDSISLSAKPGVGIESAVARVKH